MSEEQNGLKAGAIIVAAPLALIACMLITCLLLFGCASTEDYVKLSKIKYSVDNRLDYLDYPGWSRPKGAKPHQQNCVGFSGEYYGRLLEAGYSPAYRKCDNNGTPHMYVEVAGYALDNRFSRPVPMSMQDCK